MNCHFIMLTFYDNLLRHVLINIHKASLHHSMMDSSVVTSSSFRKSKWSGTYSIFMRQSSASGSVLGDAEDAQTGMLRCQITLRGGAERFFTALFVRMSNILLPSLKTILCVNISSSNLTVAFGAFHHIR